MDGPEVRLIPLAGLPEVREGDDVAAQIIAALGLGKGHTKFGVSIGAMDEWVAQVNP